MYGWRKRLGLMVPSSNTTMESEFHKNVPDGVSVMRMGPNDPPPPLAVTVMVAVPLATATATPAPTTSIVDAVPAMAPSSYQTTLVASS